MPVCPKCNHLVSEAHWERHLSRCGEHHKHETMPLIYNPGRGMGATPCALEVTPPVTIRGGGSDRLSGLHIR
jgi:hypothetical protein